MRPIDADVLVADYRICGGCKDLKNCDGHVVMCDSARVRQAINDAPTIEVQPVKHGKWDGYICSECNVCADYFISGDFYFDEKPNFCPNCGARMDGENT